MADKTISELIAADQIGPTDLFVLEQNETAKKLSGSVLLNWLTAAADGHGGISSIVKLRTDGLADTYRIIMADSSVFDFVLNNGRGVSSVNKISSSGLVDTYGIKYNDGSSDSFEIKNGEKGDRGDNTYLWIKYASVEPTEDSHSFGDIPDAWIGIYWGPLSYAPSDYRSYIWYKMRGETGEPGPPAELSSYSVTYQASHSGTIVPSGGWSPSIPTVSQGDYLWTRMIIAFAGADPITMYSVNRFGLDGSGAVSSVCNVYPGTGGNVSLKASDVGAVSVYGAGMAGILSMHGNALNGIRDPIDDDDAASKKYVDKSIDDKLYLFADAVEAFVDERVPPIAEVADGSILIIRNGSPVWEQLGTWTGGSY